MGITDSKKMFRKIKSKIRSKLKKDKQADPTMNADDADSNNNNNVVTDDTPEKVLKSPVVVDVDGQRKSELLEEIHVNMASDAEDQGYVSSSNNNNNNSEDEEAFDFCVKTPEPVVNTPNTSPSKSVVPDLPSINENIESGNTTSTFLERKSSLIPKCRAEQQQQQANKQQLLSSDDDDLSDDEDEEILEDWLDEQEDIKEECPVVEEKEEELSPYLQQHKPLYDVMKQVKLFCNISQMQQQEVLKSLKHQKFQDGESVVTQGERGNRFYMIIKGEAVVIKTVTDEETQKSVDIMKTHLYAGHYFGELALLYDDPRSATVQAVGNDVEMMYLTRSDFQNVRQVHLSLMLKQVPILAELDPRDQDAVLQKLTSATFASGEHIVVQGEKGDKFYIITNGEAAITESRVEDGKSVTHELTRLYEGACFGEMSLIYDQPRSATVTAVGRVKCLYLTKRDFDDSIQSSERFHRFIQQVYIEKATTRALRNRQQKKQQQEAIVPLPPPVPSSLLQTTTQETHKLVKHRLANGEKVLNKYVIKGEIGRGQYGRVQLAMSEEDRKLYAIKVMQKSFTSYLCKKEDQFQASLQRETAIMKKLNHKNVVRLKEVIDDPSSQKIYLVQEYIERGNLMEVIQKEFPLGEERARKYMRDLLCGIRYLHFNRIIHRDIKPENLLLSSEDVVKIADFGAADNFVHESETLTDAKGTPAFMAPELFQSGDNIAYVGSSADIWSSGATLFMMIFGYPPWQAENEIVLANKIQRDELVFPENSNIAPSLRNLLQRFLTKDPKRRITLADAMGHEWITKEGSDPLPIQVDSEQVTVSAEESEGAIQAIPQQIDPRFYESLQQASNIIQQRCGDDDGNKDVKHHQPPPAPITKLTRHTSDTSIDSNVSVDSSARILSAWRYHRRAVLVSGHTNLSQRSKDMLMDQKRTAFSADRAEVQEIIMSASDDDDDDDVHTISSLDRSDRALINENSPTRKLRGIKSMVSPTSHARNESRNNSRMSVTDRVLSRKKDFLMVTSEVMRSETGSLQKRKVLFQAKDNDFSIATPGKGLSASSHEMISGNRKASMVKKKTMSADDNTTNSSDKLGHIEGAITVSSGDEESSDESSDDDDEEDYSDVEADVDIDDTFEELISTPRNNCMTDDEDFKPLHASFKNSDEAQEFQVSASDSQTNLTLGLRAGYAEAKGKRPYMEDRITFLPKLLSSSSDNTNNATAAYFAVYDGHGGDATSSILQERLHLEIQDQFDEGDENEFENAILEGCRIMDDKIIDDNNSASVAAAADKANLNGYSTSGSTAALAILGKTNDLVVLTVANVGDCRAVLCRGDEVLELTRDHKASLTSEKERIENAGGFVHNGRLNGMLAVSRAFGDAVHKSDKQLISVPEVNSVPITCDDEFLLLASDGLFDVITSEQAVRFLRRKIRVHSDIQLACQELVAKALALLGHDNCSVCVVCLNQL